MNSHSAFPSTAATAKTSQWAWHLGALGAIVVAILATFQYEVANALEVWWYYPAYSHCYLVVPISAWLVWRKRAQLACVAPTIAPKALLIFPFLTLAWLAGYFTTINEARQFAVVAMIITAILTMLGPQVFRIVAFPSLYLFFLVPFGQYFIPPMQQFTAWFTDVGLNVLGVPHYTEGTIFELPNGRFEIADACAGLRFLTAAVALGVLFVQLTYSKWWKSAVFLAASVVVPLIGNGLRCVGTMALAYWTNDFDAVAANHITAGFIFNVIIILISFWIGSLFRDHQETRDQPMRAEIRAVPRIGLSAVVVGLLAMIGTGPVFAYWQENQPVTAAIPLIFPRMASDWVVLPPSDSWHPLYPAPDQALNNQIAPQSEMAPAVDVKVLYYGRIRKENSLISTTNRLWDVAVWHGIEARNVDANLGNQSVRFDENVVTNLSNSSEKRIIWSSYWLDRQFTTSALKVKLLQLRGIALRNEGSALIALSTPIDGPINAARARLKAALSALGNLPKDLDAAGRARELPIASN